MTMKELAERDVPAFTPGPWEARRFHVHVEGKGTLCSVSNPWNDESERQANTQLIAAAPEMYRELVVQRNDLLARGYSPTDEEVTRISAVLAKARASQESAQ